MSYIGKRRKLIVSVHIEIKSTVIDLNLRFYMYCSYVWLELELELGLLLLCPLSLAAFYVVCGLQIPVPTSSQTNRQDLVSMYTVSLLQWISLQLCMCTLYTVHCTSCTCQ